MIKNILNNDQGFTLIEALIAIFILTIGIFALTTMQIQSTQGNSQANQLTTASILAGNSYERLLSLNYDDIALDPAGNPHANAELAGLQLPTGVTSISWNVVEWTNTDGLDNDGDGIVDEADELSIKSITLTINYTTTVAKTLTINFLKSEVF